MAEDEPQNGGNNNGLNFDDVGESSGEPDVSLEEVAIGADDTVNIRTYRLSNDSTSSPSVSATQDKVPIIPATSYAPAYHSDFIANLHKVNFLPHSLEDHFKHLNCFHLTVPNGCSGPTLDSLKQHAQAICLYIHLASPESRIADQWPEIQRTRPFPTTFAFLNNLKEVFTPSGIAEHQIPLPGLVNTVHLGVDVRQFGTDELLSEASKILTRLNRAYRHTGGIDSIPLPPATSPLRHCFLAQWIVYVRQLKLRLASIVKRSLALREALNHQLTLPGVRGKRCGAPYRNSDQREPEIVFPQDRYVFTGLADDLWKRLDRELSVRGEKLKESTEQETKQARGVFRRGQGDFPLDGDEIDGQHNVVRWIETSSRLYRVRGHDTIFVIPGFGLHPGAKDLHWYEAQSSLLQTTDERRAGEKTKPRTAGEMREQLPTLRNSIARLEEQLKLKQDNDKTRTEPEETEASARAAGRTAASPRSESEDGEENRGSKKGSKGEMSQGSGQAAPADFKLQEDEGQGNVPAASEKGPRSRKKPGEAVAGGKDRDIKPAAGKRTGLRPRKCMDAGAGEKSGQSKVAKRPARNTSKAPKKPGKGGPGRK